MVDGHPWWPAGAVSPWHATSHLAPSTTTRPASGTAAVRAGSTAPRRRLRTLRVNRTGGSAPRSRSQGPQPQGTQTPTRMDHADGIPPPQDPGRLPRLSRGRPRRASHPTSTMSAGEPDATENGHVRFGGGPSEKDLDTGTSLASYPTSRRDLWEPEGETPSGHPTLGRRGRVRPRRLLGRGIGAVNWPANESELNQVATRRAMIG